MSGPEPKAGTVASAAPPREARRRWLVWTLAASAAVHLLFTPLAGFISLFAWLMRPIEPEDAGEVEQLRSIPIEFLGEWAPPEPAPPEPEPLPSTTRVALAEPQAPPAPELPPETRGAKPQPPAPARETPPAPPAAKAEAKRSDGAVGHPVELAGVESKVVDSNANVNLLLLSERLRTHPLGPRIGELLVQFPQWSSFFASAELDPVRDINRILIVGPQFRRSADVVAILQHNLPQPVLVAGIDKLVKRPPRGRWLPGKLKAARAHADRAERVFALTAPQVLVVAPPALERVVLNAPPQAFPAPEGDEALVVHIRTPWRALMGLPFNLPESIEWLRLDVTPLANGGARARLTARDADAAQAARHARDLTVAINTLTNPDLGALGALMGVRSIAFIDKLSLQAQGEHISGQVNITQRQLERLLVYAEELVRTWTGRRDVAPSRAPATSLSSPPSSRAQPGQSTPAAPATPSSP